MVSSTTRCTVIKAYLEISIQARRLENETGVVRQWGPVQNITIPTIALAFLLPSRLCRPIVIL
jgi:hypothetical protein